MGKLLKTKTDAELLTAYIAGDDDAFEEIVSRYKEPLYGFLKRFLNRQDIVEDVFQDTFLQLFTSRESFDPERPLRPWLFTIAANKARDSLRKQQRDSSTSVGAMGEPSELSVDDIFNIISSYDITPYDEVQKSEIAGRVRKVVSEMSENLREILILAYFEQFSYKQMAEILGIPIGTVKSRLHTAVGSFAKKWREGQGNREKQ